MREVTKEILTRINDGKTLETISKETDMRKSTVRARVDSMIHEGYIWNRFSIEVAVACVQ